MDFHIAGIRQNNQKKLACIAQSTNPDSVKRLPQIENRKIISYRTSMQLGIRNAESEKIKKLKL